MKLITIIILSLFLPVTSNAPMCDSVGRARTTMAHQYHGIWFSTYGRVQDTFEREGKTCKLYTKGCERYIGRKLRP